MSTQLTLSATVEYDDGIWPKITGQVADRKKTVTTTRPFTIIQQVAITEEAVQLGDAATLGGSLFLQNLDPTNYIDVKTGTGGTIFARLGPDTNSDGKGGFLLLDLMGSGALAPFVIANTAVCRMGILVCPP